jgi:hypothetical protein
VAGGFVRIDNLELTFTDIEFFDNRIKMKFPAEFFSLLRGDDQNNLIYGNTQYNVNFFLSLVPKIKIINIKKLKKDITEGFKASQLATKWILDGAKRADGGVVEYCACINPAPGESVFNFLMFPVVRDGHIVMNLNGGSDDFEKWTLISNAMIKTMVIN